VKRVLFVILAVFIIATVAVYAVFARDMTVARARLAGRSQTTQTSFGTLEYALMGEGEPMLIVHGAAGGFDQGMDMTGSMAGRGYRLIVPSRFGYLRSTMPDNPTTAMQADAYVQLLDHLGIDKVVVVGISAGGWSSLQFAIRHPERCRALPYPIEKIACPVLAISAEDDRFGTASRAKYIAASVPDGRTIIFPTGGHALVGHYADALREITSFLQTVQKGATSKNRKLSITSARK
jgi:pimeloyl-ACP methyl ester carboxylesterase